MAHRLGDDRLAARRVVHRCAGALRQRADRLALIVAENPALQSVVVDAIPGGTLIIEEWPVHEEDDRTFGDEAEDRRGHADTVADLPTSCPSVPVTHRTLADEESAIAGDRPGERNRAAALRGRDTIQEARRDPPGGGAERAQGPVEVVGVAGRAKKRDRAAFGDEQQGRAAEAGFVAQRDTAPAGATPHSACRYPAPGASANRPHSSR